MSEWAIIILLACVSANGITETKEVGLGVNQKGELIIVAPPELDVHLKPSHQIGNMYLMYDETNNPYSIQLNQANNKFIFFIHKLEATKTTPKDLKKIDIKTFKTLNNIMISTMDSQISSIFENAFSNDK